MIAAILAVVVFAIASAAFGVGVWRDAVRAQSQVGRASLHYVGGLIAQGAWNELPLVLPAGAGVWLVWTHRERPLDMELMWTLVAATLAGLLLALTVFKRGSYINVLVVAEPPLRRAVIGGDRFVIPAEHAASRQCDAATRTRKFWGRCSWRLLGRPGHRWPWARRSAACRALSGGRDRGRAPDAQGVSPRAS
jgi:hypothetical protein